MAAGTSYVTLTMSDGSTLSVYISTSAAIGVIPNVNQIGVAGTTTPTEFMFPRDVEIRDQVNTVGTAGGVSAGIIEVYNIREGRKSSKFLELETTGHAATVNSRNVPKIKFRGGVPYRFVVSTAQVSA